MIVRAVLIVLTVVAGAVAAQASDGAIQPYDVKKGRPETSLSPDDLAQIEAGQGWGLAKPAELNGYPGPAHVLELSDELKLSDAQRQEIEVIFKAMKAAAIAAGKLYIDAERKVDEVFRSGSARPDQLSGAAMSAGKRLAALRVVHLEADITTAALISTNQGRH